MVYPTAKEAISAVVESSPGLKFMLGELTETLAVAGERLCQSALGKKAIQLSGKIAPKIAHIENKLINVEYTAMQKLGMVPTIEVEAALVAKTATKAELTVAKTLPQEIAILQKNIAEKIDHGVRELGNTVNQTCEAILKNGYYEVNGFRFSEFYYNKLWQSGRGAPSLAAQAILDNPIKVIPDPAGYSGFFKYFTDEWESIQSNNKNRKSYTTN